MNKILGSVIRHALTGVGAVLVYVGVGEAESKAFVDAAAPVIAGVASFAIGQGWSILSKIQRRF